MASNFVGPSFGILLSDWGWFNLRITTICGNDADTAEFKKLIEFDITLSIRNRLGSNRIDTDTRYETSIESVETRYNSVNLIEFSR